MTAPYQAQRHKTTTPDPFDFSADIRKVSESVYVLAFEGPNGTIPILFDENFSGVYLGKPGDPQYNNIYHD